MGDKTWDAAAAAIQKEQSDNKKMAQAYDPTAIYVSIKELAKEAGISKSTILRMARDGTIEATKYVAGGKAQLLIHPDEAKRYLDELNEEAK